MSTTKDPVRLVLDPSCPESQRALLGHGTNIEPPRDAEARIWQALIGAIGATAVGGSADASTKTTTAAAKVQAAGLTTAKMVALAASLAGLVALGGYLVASSKDTRPPVSIAPGPAAQAPVTAPPLQPAAGVAPWDDAIAPGSTERPRPTPGARRSVGARPRPGVASGPSPAAPSSPSRLREETTLVREARQALRGGDAARALRVLEECRRLFPAGVLEQERERLIVEALIKGGRASEAAVRATEFLRKYPDSPHAGEVRALGLTVSGSR
jgi:hypothetical protein